MTAQQLKNSILQLAIQGKLVPQDPNDEPASVLLERIRQEKENLVKQGKIKRDKNPSVIFRGADNITYEKTGLVTRAIDDELPFEIPESWAWARLGNIGDWGAGATPIKTKQEYYGGEIPWLKTGDLNDGFINEIPSTITQLALKECSLRLNPIGSVLIAMYGATIGKLGILNVASTTNQACCACLPLMIVNKYLFFFLMGWKEKFTKQAEGGAQPNISKEKIVSTLFPVPPLKEQKRIVSKIETLLPLVESYGKRQVELDDLNATFPETLKKSILQEAIQGRLVGQDPNDEPASVLLERIREEKERLIKLGKIKRDKKESVIYRRGNSLYVEQIDDKLVSIDEEIPFEIPESWEWVRLNRIAGVLGGKRIPAGRTLTSTNTGHYYIRVSDMKNSSVDTSRLLYVPNDIYPSIARYIINKEDIYITVAGTIGKVGKIPASLDGANLTENADRLVFRLINQDWFISCLSSDFIQQQILWATTKVGQPKLAIKRIEELLIPLPPLNEQKRIRGCLDRLFPIIDGMKRFPL